jgi:hypothetical protein
MKKQLLVIGVLLSVMGQMQGITWNWDGQKCYGRQHERGYIAAKCCDHTKAKALKVKTNMFVSDDYACVPHGKGYKSVYLGRLTRVRIPSGKKVKSVDVGGATNDYLIVTYTDGSKQTGIEEKQN